MRQASMTWVLLVLWAGTAAAQAPPSSAARYMPPPRPAAAPPALPPTPAAIRATPPASSSRVADVKPVSHVPPPPPPTWDDDADYGGLFEESSRPCFYLTADYLLWWVKSAPLGPPLLTGDRIDPFSHIATAGGLSDPNTIVLIGNESAAYDAFSGGRWLVGWGFSECLAIESTFLVLQEHSQSKSVNSNGQGVPFLFRPIINTDTGNANAGAIVAIQDNFVGGMTVTSRTQLWGAEANLAGNWVRNSQVSVDGLLGFRFLQVEEDLLIASSSTVIPPFGPVFGIPFNGGLLTGIGDGITTAEKFSTRNQFYGAQAGLRGSAAWGRLDLAGAVKLGLGSVHQTVSILGSTTGTAAGVSTTVPGAVLAVASNSGTFTHSKFAVLPELNVQVGCRVASWLRAYVGYDFLYVSNVVRPGDQINLSVNDTQVPQSPAFGLAPTGPLSPPPPSFRSTDFWAQGLSFGFELRF